MKGEFVRFAQNVILNCMLSMAKGMAWSISQSCIYNLTDDVQKQSWLNTWNFIDPVTKTRHMNIFNEVEEKCGIAAFSVILFFLLREHRLWEEEHSDQVT